MPEPYDVHTCHADCPCHRDEEPLSDFASWSADDAAALLEHADHELRQVADRLRAGTPTTPRKARRDG